MWSGPDGERIRWPQISVFYALALIGPILGALVIRAFTDSVAPLTGWLLAMLVMPAPLFAALVVMRRSPIVEFRTVFGSLRQPARVVLWPLLVFAVWFVSCLAITALVGNVMDIDAAGGIAGSADDIRVNLAVVLDADAAASADVPPVAVLVMVGFVGAIIAGVTVNGLVALGEEYGWREFLWVRLESWGRWGTVGVIGVAWACGTPRSC